MAISDPSKPFTGNRLEGRTPSPGFIGKGEFEIRLTEPVNSLNSQGALVNGLEELFSQTVRSTTQQLIFLICSAWLSAEAFCRLFDSLKGRGHHLLIITHRAHAPNHWASLANTWKKLGTKFSIIGVGTLPREDGSLPLSSDALHAKLYAVGIRPPTAFSKSCTPRQNLLNAALRGISFMTSIECFFGSANFTTGGLGQKVVPNMKYDCDKKWELVGRATNAAAMRAITETFGSLWKRADIRFVDKMEFLPKNFSRILPEPVCQGEQAQQKRRSSILLVLITIFLTSAAFLFITALVKSYQDATSQGKNIKASMEMIKERKKSQNVESRTHSRNESKNAKN